jgi:tripartite-type tricarboxylate transporter receptor subunit TctC
MKTRSLWLSAVVALVLPFSVLAEGYPDRPVLVTVAYSPGGATDFQARIVTMMAAQESYLGQPLVIVNKPGAGGQVGWNWFAQKAKGDGYQLAAYNIPHFIAQSIVFKTKYSIDNLEPIANWGADPAVLIVNKDSQFNSAKELLDFAKQNPGKVTISGAGQFTGHHVAMLQLAKAAGVTFKYIPTKGGVKALQRVLGGDVTAGFNNLSDSYRSRNKLKILAIADLERDKEFLPDVPTFKELGVDVDNSSVNFRGIMAPKGTPPEVINKLAEKIPPMFQDKKVIKKMQAGGSPMRVMSRDDVIVMWKERQSYLAELLKDLKKK